MLAVTLALVVGSVGCRSTPGRTHARADLIEQLVEEGVTTAVAACIVDAFFGDRSDDELRAFYERDELTVEERAEFVALGARCGA